MPPTFRTATAACCSSLPFLRKLYADGGYQGPVFRKALARVLRRIDGEIVKHSDRAQGFAVLPRRWIVEHTIGWPAAADASPRIGSTCNRKVLAFLRLASIRLMLRKLCNPS